MSHLFQRYGFYFQIEIFSDDNDCLFFCNTLYRWMNAEFTMVFGIILSHLPDDIHLSSLVFPPKPFNETLWHAALIASSLGCFSTINFLARATKINPHSYIGRLLHLSPRWLKIIKKVHLYFHICRLASRRNLRAQEIWQIQLALTVIKFTVTILSGSYFIKLRCCARGIISVAMVFVSCQLSENKVTNLALPRLSQMSLEAVENK